LLLSNFVSTTELHFSPGVQPDGIYAHMVHREPAPQGPGCRRIRKLPPSQQPPWLYIPPRWHCKMLSFCDQCARHRTADPNS
jgi:hypothetical protein